MDVPDDITVADLGFLHWWGPPTLYRCELDPDPTHADIALVGVPHSSGNGTTWRDQHMGPRSIRDVSMAYQRLHLKWQFDPWNAVRIRDVGDVPILNTLVNDVAVREIERFFRPIDAAGARPVSFGGDHSVSLAVLRAIAGPDSRYGRPAAVVHFDAHYDTYDDFPNWYGRTTRPATGPRSRSTSSTSTRPGASRSGSAATTSGWTRARRAASSATGS
jgi:guanidinopropionase